MNQETIAFVQKLLDQIQATVTKHGPQAWALAQQVDRLTCIGIIAGGLACVVVSALLVCGTFFTWKKYREDLDGDMGGFSCICFIFGLGATAPFFIGFFGALLNTWAWIGMFRPDLDIVHDIYVKVLGGA